MTDHKYIVLSAIRFGPDTSVCYVSRSDNIIRLESTRTESAKNTVKNNMKTIYESNGLKFDTIIELNEFVRSTKIKVGRKRSRWICRISLTNNTVEEIGSLRDIYDKYIDDCIEDMKQLRKANELLKSENETLKTMLHYQPDGDGAKECKEHFESLCEKNE